MAALSRQITPHVNHSTREIVTVAMKVHTILGPGLLQSAYHACLVHELRKQGFRVASRVGLPVVYDGEKIELGYRVDLVVENTIIVEVKCVEAIHPVLQAQLLSYMRLSGINVGLLIKLQWRPPSRRDQTHGRWLELEQINHRGHRVSQGKSAVVLCILCG